MQRGKTFLACSAAALPPLLVGLAVHRQGFNLLDDGLWLLGTRVLAEGGALYGDLFSIYGPARYLLLLPFFQIFGQSALTLAVFKAVLDGAAAGFGWWYVRRLGAGRWAWLVPLGVVALGPVDPRYVAAALFAALVGELLIRPASQRTGGVIGLAWGGLALFGLDMAGYGGVILLGGTALSGAAMAPGRAAWWRGISGGLIGGLAAVVAVAVVAALAAGVLPQAVWDTVVYPLTRFGEAMGVSWLDSFRHDPALRQPFGSQFTGEVLPGLWDGHAGQRALALQGMFLLVWLIPPGLIWVARRSAEGRLGPLAALALAGWATLLARGDVFHLRLIWMGTLLAATVLVARAPGARRWRAGAGALLVLVVILPLAVEKAWLATNLARPGLVRWQRPTAGVHLAADRAEILEAVCADLPWDGASPVLVWPAQPGLQFVLAAPLATPQATLLGGEVRRPEAIVADLERRRPPVAVLGSARGLVAGASDVRGLAPDLWGYLRRNYHATAELVTEGEAYHLATRATVSDGRAPPPPPDRRLPGAAQQTRTSASPALGPGRSVAQTFRVEDFDLGAVELMFRGPGPFPYPVSLLVTFHRVGGPQEPRQLLQFPFRVVLEERTQKVRFNFQPLAGTVGGQVLMEIRGHPDGTRPFQLLWNKATAEVPRFDDTYPAGRAYLDKQAQEADLYFVTY